MASVFCDAYLNRKIREYVKLNIKQRGEVLYEDATTLNEWTVFLKRLGNIARESDDSSEP
jgi:hypothetical protein